MRQTTPHQPTITTQQFTKMENFRKLFSAIVFHLNVFVKPNEQCRACSDIVMARIGNRRHGALSEVERQNALLRNEKRTICTASTTHNYPQTKSPFALQPTFSDSQALAFQILFWQTLHTIHFHFCLGWRKTSATPRHQSLKT